MEPRPQRPRSQVGQGPSATPHPQRQAPGVAEFPEGGDPATFIAPSRTEYDYSPLDLAPPGQRRRRQFVAAAIGGFTVLLLGALAVFGYLVLREDQPTNTQDDVIVAQTELAQSRATIAAQETIVARAAAEQTAQARGDSGSAATPPPAAASTSAPDGEVSTVPTTTGAAGQTPETGAAAAPTQPPAGNTAGTSGALTAEQLSALLPDAAAAPPGLDAVSDNERDLAGVVEALGGTRSAETNLTTWGWTGNVERQFNASDPTALEAGATSFLSISIHGFATPDAAAEALPFFSDILLNGGGYEELEAPQLGDSARLLQIANDDGTTNIALYVQDGTVLYRVGASSTEGDTAKKDVIDIMTAVLDQSSAP